MIINFIRGFLMALADSVPGVSGGTIAFILGFYDQFISSIKLLISGNIEEKKQSLIFLVKLLFGWVVGFLLAASILVSIFDEHIYEISSLFIGFILFAIPIVYKDEKANLEIKLTSIIAFVVGIIVVIGICSLRSLAIASMDLTNLNLFNMIYIFLSAMLAISAMVLPGISGSTLLLIFGLYLPILTAVKALMHLNFAYLPALIIFGLGILVGVASVIKIISWALEKHRRVMIFFIIGMMIGSFYAIIQGPTTLEVPKAAMSLSTFHIVFFLIGGAIMIGLQVVKDKLEKK